MNQDQAIPFLLYLVKVNELVPVINLADLFRQVNDFSTSEKPRQMKKEVFGEDLGRPDAKSHSIPQLPTFFFHKKIKVLPKHK